MPEHLLNETGYFKISWVKPFVAEKAQPVPIKRKDYFKIMPVTGDYILHYANMVAELKKPALSFYLPPLPYQW